MEFPTGPDEKTFILTDTRHDCGGHLYLWYLPSTPASRYLVACHGCGKILYNGTSTDEAEKTIAALTITPTTVQSDLFMSKKEIYQANKNRKTCIMCSKPTEKRSLFTGVVFYCPHCTE